MYSRDHDFSDCQHYDLEKERLRGCLIGRVAPTDCPTCTEYQPVPFFNFADEIDEEY